uniref:Uncharacterized protein n=1 Tax=viral metagenome TaxID=1070528 RepID=A0A6C0LIP5_9ZZZZ
MARVQPQQIYDVLDSMNNLGGQTDTLLDMISQQQAANTEAIRQMGTASDLLRRLLQSRGEMEEILAASGRARDNQGDNVKRIRDALGGQPTVEEMRAAIQDLEQASNSALQAGLPSPPPQSSSPPLNANASTFTPASRPGPSVGGYDWRSSIKKTKTKTKRRKSKGGYDWRSSGRKTKTKIKNKNKTKTRRKNKSNRSNSSSRRSKSRR